MRVGALFGQIGRQARPSHLRGVHSSPRCPASRAKSHGWSATGYGRSDRRSPRQRGVRHAGIRSPLAQCAEQRDQRHAEDGEMASLDTVEQVSRRGPPCGTRRRNSRPLAIPGRDSASMNARRQRRGRGAEPFRHGSIRRAPAWPAPQRSTTASSGRKRREDGSAASSRSRGLRITLPIDDDRAVAADHPIVRSAVRRRRLGLRPGPGQIVAVASMPAA